MVELIAKYESHRFTFGETIIASARLSSDSHQIAAKNGINPDHPITIRGAASLDDFTTGQNYRLIGHWTDYTNKRTQTTEKQFSFKTFAEHIPPTTEGITGYIASHGKGFGVGPSKAARLVKEFGIEDVLNVCRTQPDEIKRVAKIDIELATEFSKMLATKAETESTSLALDSLLAGNGFPKTLIRRVIKEWGATAPKRITEDPFCLMAFRGVGFRLADKLYMRLGLDPANIRRQALAIQWILSSDSSGHIWFLATEIANKLQSVIGSTTDFIAAVKHARDIEFPPLVVTLRTDGNTGHVSESGQSLWIADANEARNESELADRITEASSEAREEMITIWEDTIQVESILATFIRCARCGRALITDEVFVVDGKPYGPTCVEKVI